jgi:hypothetical protein
MRYGLLEVGDKIKRGDEFYIVDTNVWDDVSIYTHGLPYKRQYLPIRRPLDSVEPLETVTVPCGTWEGCTGDVFMDGESKKVRLHNVFYGGKRVVINYPLFRMYDGKNRIVGDNEIIRKGDQFINHLYQPVSCEATIGYSAGDAKTMWREVIRFFIRPVQ